MASDTEPRLRRHVETLAAEIGERNVFHSEALQAAADYIEAEWRGQGHEVVRQTYRVGEVECSNLEVTCRGALRPDEIILVGAHYDSVQGSPGANDNASGVAGLLEIGRGLRHVTPGRTVRLVAFVNEEAPFFWWGQMGSMVYARAARRRRDDIRLMISLEMLGCYSDEPGSQSYPPLFRYFYPDRGNFIAMVSNFRSCRMLRRTVSAFRGARDVPLESVATFGFVPGVSWSDPLAFWRQGYRALMVTDTAFYRYPYYHSALDTPEKIDYPIMARVTEGLLATIESLAATRTGRSTAGSGPAPGR